MKRPACPIDLAGAKVLGIKLPGDLSAAAATKPRRTVANATEARFAREVLDPYKRSGIIDGYTFEGIKILLAAATPATDGQAKIPAAYYTPDFIVWKHGCQPCCVEIKGYWEEAARLRIKVAADRHDYLTFVAVKYIGRRWEYERFGMGAWLI